MHKVAKNEEDLSKVNREKAGFEASLLKAGALQKAILNSANFSSIATDEKGVIQLFNVGAERMLGYAAVDVVDKITPADISDPQEVIARAKELTIELDTVITPGFEALVFKASRGIEDIYELTYIRKDGSRFPAIVSVTALRDPQAGIIGYLLIGTDNTARKAEEEIRQQAKTLDLTQSIVRDTKGRISLWTSGAERLYGYTREEAIGQTSHKFLQTQFPEPLEHIEEKLKRGGTWKGELVHRKRDGARIVVASVWALHLDANHRPLSILETNIDVTDAKRTEERLAEQAKELLQQASELTDSKQALELQTALLQSVLDSMSEGIAAADERGHFVLWNPAAEKILGQGMQALSNETWSKHYGLFLTDMVTPFPHDQLPLARAIRGEVSTAEMYVRTSSLVESAWIEVSGAPRKDKDGIARGGVAVFHDITRQKADEQEIRKLNEELEQRVEERTEQLEIANKDLANLAAVVASSDDAIISMSLDGRITAWNMAAEELFGYTAIEATGKLTQMLFPEDHAQDESAILARIVHGEIVRLRETVRIGMDGKNVDVSVTISPIKDQHGAIVGASKIARDITEHKRAQDEIQKLSTEMSSRNTQLEIQATALQQATDELELRVQERTVELAAANEVLGRSNLELQQFAYIASHDLQSPLRSISGFVQLLQSEYTGKLDEQANGWIQRTVQAIAQMQTLIRDLLSYSRVDSRSRPFEPTALLDVVHDAMSLLESSIRDSGGQVTTGDLPVVMGDRVQLVQLMQNLIGNGLKYHSAAPPHIHVSAQHDTNGWLFSVQDNGIGIAPQYREQIFEIFKRLHDQKEYPGTGIGLAVCSRVVNRHGGKIWVKPEPGPGTTFQFTIPEGTITS